MNNQVFETLIAITKRSKFKPTNPQQNPFLYNPKSICRFEPMPNGHMYIDVGSKTDLFDFELGFAFSAEIIATNQSDIDYLHDLLTIVWKMHSLRGGIIIENRLYSDKLKHLIQNIHTFSQV